MEKKQVRQIAGSVIVILGITFTLSTLLIILTIITTGNANDYFADEKGEGGFWWYRAQFWIVIAALLVFLISGGKLSKLTVLGKFPYDDNKSEHHR